MKKNKKPAALLAAAILLAGISPAAAVNVFADIDTGSAGASLWNSPADSSSAQGAGRLQELHLKPGSRNVEINGTQETILRSPYLSGGVLMVPLGVFTAAFGAETEMGDGNTVRIVLGQHAVTLTIGSPVIWTSQGKGKAAASPALVNGVLTVPLRQVAEGLGARLSSGANGEIVVSRLGAAGDESEEDNGEDPAGRVGNSFYGWSIDNPGEQIPDAPGQESSTSFSGPDSSYYLQVHVLTGQPEQDAFSLLDNLAEDVAANGGIILDESTGATAGHAPYARIIFSGDSVSGVEETRAYYKDHKVYLVYLSVAGASSYQDFDDYSGLLDSFEPTFNSEDPALSDLVQTADGTKLVYAYPDSYNIALQLPQDWEQDSNPGDFSGPDDQHIHVSVSSSPSGLSLEGWAKQLEQTMSQTYITSAYREQGTAEATWSGEQGLVVKSQVNTDGEWSNLYQALLIKDGYRYLIEYKDAPQTDQKLDPQVSAAAAPETSAPASNSGDADQPDGDMNQTVIDANQAADEDNKAIDTGDKQLDQLLAGVDIPFDGIKQSFGHLEDPGLESDLSKTATKTSSPYHFTIQLPRYWSTVLDSTDTSSAKYSFPGGSFKLSTTKTDEPELQLGDLRSAYTAASGNAGFSLTSMENTTFAGVPATIFSIHQKLDGASISKRVIAFERQGIFYTLTFSLNDANATPEQQAAISKAEKSFAFVQ